MCRNAKIPSKKKLQALFPGMELPVYTECDNANAFDHPDVPIMKAGEPDKLYAASWGLIPEYIKTIDAAVRAADMLRNAKAESIFDKPSFSPYIMQKRCLIFLEGFYEWQHLDPKGKKKQAYYVSMKNDEVFATGGIYTEWFSPTLNQVINTCCIITTASNPLMSEIHNSKERQPLIFDKENWDKWLTKDLTKEEIVNLMTIYPDTNMKADKAKDKPKPKDDNSEQGALF
jgi:putative SOS response-associated peptidase YedK